MRKKSVQSLTHSAPELKQQSRTLLGRALGFRDCPAATLDGLVQQGSGRTFDKGQALTRQGDLLNAMCLLVKGALEVSVTRRDGRRHMVSYIGVGDIVGMISILDGMREMSDIYARSECAVLVMPGEAVRALLRTDSQLGVAIAVQLARRSRFNYERLAADPSLPIATRLMRLLNSMHRDYGPVKLSQSELADWVGASRQSVNFALQGLQKAGLIRIDYSAIDIVDAKAFAAYLAES